MTHIIKFKNYRIANRYIRRFFPDAKITTPAARKGRVKIGIDFVTLTPGNNEYAVFYVDGSIELKEVCHDIS